MLNSSSPPPEQRTEMTTAADGRFLFPGYRQRRRATGRVSRQLVPDQPGGVQGREGSRPVVGGVSNPYRPAIGCMVEVDLDITILRPRRSIPSLLEIN